MRPVVKMDRKRLKIAVAVLNAVKSRFLETQEFIDSTLKEECEKERMNADEVIFYKFKSKKLAWINILFQIWYYSAYFFVYRCGKAWRIVKRQNVYQKKR